MKDEDTLTRTELLRAIRQLRNTAGGGLDGVVPEQLTMRLAEAIETRRLVQVALDSAYEKARREDAIPWNDSADETTRGYLPESVDTGPGAG